MTEPILAVIDGSKALRRAILDVFDHAVIHRCQLDKSETSSRNCPTRWVAEMRAAYRNTDPLAAEAELEALARQLAKAHPGAAGSLRGGWPRR